MNQPIDLTKGRLRVAYTIWPNGVRSEYLPPGCMISIPYEINPPECKSLDFASVYSYLMTKPEYGQLTMTPREYYENYYKNSKTTKK